MAWTPRTRWSGADAASVRIVGALGAFGGVCAVAAGAANWRTANPARDIRGFIAIGAYFILASGATIALRRIGALLLVTPPALAGIAAVAATAVQGPPVAFLLNLAITAPLLCGPAYVVWRSRRALR